MTVVEFDDDERAAIIAETQRLRAEPPPRDRRGVGCVTVLVSGFLLLVLPPTVKKLGWPPLVADVLFWLLVMPCAVGFFAAFFLTTSRYSQASARVQDALAWLSSHPDARDAEARRHAVVLICCHVINDDGGLAQVVGIEEAKEKLGASLHYVVAVERVLTGEGLSESSFGNA